MDSSPKLCSDTISLCPFTEHHLSKNYISWLNNSALMAYSEQRHRAHTLESCAMFVKSFEQGPNLLWAIEVNATNEHIGNITVSIDTNNRLADIGLLLGAQQGKGFGHIAWKTVMTYLGSRKDLRKITGGCMQKNTAMVRIMESCGMSLDCVREAHYLQGTDSVDLVFYSAPGAWKPTAKPPLSMPLSNTLSSI